MNVEGIGLGLAICKRIVENSGGEITVSSDGENRGSTFKFSMHMEKPSIAQIIENKIAKSVEQHQDQESS